MTPALSDSASRVHAAYLVLVVLGSTVVSGPLPGQTPSSQEGFVTTEDSVRLYYRAIGTGEDTLVVVHGGPGGSMEEIAHGFAPLAARHVLIFYDQRGGGRSTRPAVTAHLTAAYQIDDLDAIRRRFSLRRMRLVGHSYGALLTATYAIAHPSEVASLVILAGLGPRRDRVWERMDSVTTLRLGPARRARVEEAKLKLSDPATDAADACREFISAVLPARLADPERMMPRLSPHFCTEDRAAIRYAFLVAGPAILESYGDWDLRARLRQLRMPTLIMHGTEDVFPVGIAEEWLAVLPQARLVLVPAAGHFLFVEQPELVWPAIEGFLTAMR